MDLKSRIEVANCLIMSEQNNIESPREESCDEDPVYKNAYFYLHFPLCPLLKIIYFYVSK